LEYKVHSQQYLDFDLSDFPENTNLTLHEYTLLKEQNTIMAVYSIALHVLENKIA